MSVNIHSRKNDTKGTTLLLVNTQWECGDEHLAYNVPADEMEKALAAAKDACERWENNIDDDTTPVQKFVETALRDAGINFEKPDFNAICINIP